MKTQLKKKRSKKWFTQIINVTGAAFLQLKEPDLSVRCAKTLIFAHCAKKAKFMTMLLFRSTKTSLNLLKRPQKRPKEQYTLFCT